MLSGLSVDVKGKSDIDISGICNHSTTVSPGNLFVAKKGAKYDGTLYIGDAKSFGAVAVLTDLYNPFIKDIVQVITSDIASTEAVIAQRYYKHPSKQMVVMGITGTNGKTTTAYLARHLLNANNNVALLGTIEREFLDYQFSSKLTTPDSIDMQKYLHEIHSRGAQRVVMEVTSHALCQKRVSGVDFDVGVFTNLSVDHLDYHGSMQAYFEAKKSLFCDSKVAARKHVINIDDTWGKKLASMSQSEVLTYGIDSKEADLRASNIVVDSNRMRFQLAYNHKSVLCHCPIIGTFNVYNVLAAAAMALTEDLSLDSIADRLKTFAGVPGRMEWIRSTAPYCLCIDFAHTQEALKQTLISLSQIKKKRLITLFGCGGERDKSKRKAMAKIAEAFSDLIVITSDNARSEDPDVILNSIERGFSKKANFVRLKHRKEAIAFAMDKANEDDIILIAGRGHEQYLHLGGERVPFNDKQVVLDILREKKYTGKNSR